MLRKGREKKAPEMETLLEWYLTLIARWQERMEAMGNHGTREHKIRKYSNLS